MAAIKEWGEKAAHTTFFEYSDPYCLPRLFFPLQEEMFKFMGANKVAGMFVENAPTLGEGPRLYLYMKQMWNPDVDAAAVVDDWCEATVGAKAAPYLEEYLDFWEKFWRREVPKTAWFQNSKDNVYMTFGFGGYMYALRDGDMAECRKLMERMVEAAGTPEEKKRAELLMAFFELYEANAVASVAELIPVGAQAESEEQAVAILRATPRACEYLKKRDAIIDRLCVLYPYLARPDFKSGLYYQADPFTDGIITAVTPFAKCPSVAAELAKLAADPAVSPGLRGQALVFLKLATDRASLKNLLENGSFEGPAIPWACSFAHARSPRFAADGKQSLEVVQQDSRVLLHAFVPAKPDTDYMFVAKVFVPRGQVSVEALRRGRGVPVEGRRPLAVVHSRHRSSSSPGNGTW